MNHYNFSPELVFTAYKKLKHYFYYDNTTLLTRKMIAQFEEKHLKDLNVEQVKTRLKVLVDQAFIDVFSDKILIDTYVLPKTIKKPHVDFITNYKNNNEPLKVQRFNVLCNASVEIHIISTLWMMELGRFVDKTISQNNYAYQMNLNINEDSDIPWENFKLYQPYFVQYQNWRDGSIAKAEALMNENRNVCILSLDIKDYFHSVRLNFEKLEFDVNLKIDEYYKNNKVGNVQDKRNSTKYLIDALLKIHKSYAGKLRRYYPVEDDGKLYPLPIGLISSGLLGNYHLNDFDAKVIDKLNPAYYGRYVDDLMFVFSDLKISANGYTSTINTFLNKYFVDRGILEFEIDADTQYFFGTDDRYIDSLKDLPNLNIPSNIDVDMLHRLQAKELKFHLKDDAALKIQASKVIFHYFDYRESKAALNIFKQRLEEQRSEFRFLPDEDEVSKEFDLEAFSLQYNDSINKFRSIQDFSEDKYGASKFLAKKIFARNFGPKEEDDELTDRQILTFFKDYVGISFYSLWEKVATYFIISGRGDHLIRFKRNIETAIINMSVELADGNQEIDVFVMKMKEDITEFLKISIAIPLSLNPGIKLEFLNKNEELYFADLQKDYVTPIRVSNLFRQSLVNLPFLNFTDYLKTDGSLLVTDSPRKTLIVDTSLGLLAPNYVSFHEVNIFQIASIINDLSVELLKVNLNDVMVNNVMTKLDVINSIPDDAFNIYYEVNYGWKKIQTKKEELKLLYFNIALNNDGKGGDTYINIDVNGKGDKDYNLDNVNKKVAIANIKVETYNVGKSIRKKPNIKKARRKEIFKLLNKADEEGADLIVFPEVSIPYAWLRLLAERSHKRYMGIVAGLEHWINSNDFAFNFMVTILPFKVHHYRTSLIKIRLKNHYSPKEKQLLSGNRLLIPGETVDQYPKLYDLFHWRRTYFSVYNCFELADISHRAIFRSKVDFLIASEFNADTSYFSDVAGSWVRDIHCFFIQVNSSDFGDSRLIQPAKSVAKDIIQVKGGLNSTVLVGELQIDRLREFQFVEYNLQKEMIDGGKVDFKPTPPDFNPLEVKKRMDNQNLIKHEL